MNLVELQRILIDTLKKSIDDNFDLTFETLAAEIPPKPEFGDIAFPAAFELAKHLKQTTGEKQNPREIAQTLLSDLTALDFVADVKIAGPGYLNVFFDRSLFLSNNLESSIFENPDPKSERLSRKLCVEHTSVNPNKSAHIGHVRNAVLGDTFVRILRAAGHNVEVQNYIDNTGVQVADVVVGFKFLENMTLDDIKELDANLVRNGISFDYYCWDLYAKVGVEYTTNQELKEKRAETIHLIEEGNNETAKLADYVATRNVECILATMDRLSIRYELLARESEILHLHFWQRAFEMMKQREAIKFVEGGKLAGCWVMPFESNDGNDEHEQDKILVRSNGTVTYTGKDIAYQMWKLGLLGLDFNYKIFSQYARDKQDVWVTTTAHSDAETPEFGKSARVYNVIDARQAYPQEVVKTGVATIFPDAGENASIHLSYEMVALSPAAADELGFELSADDASKTFIEMAGRKGLGVKADDLINRLEENSFLEVRERNSVLDEESCRKIAHTLAIGALRYFLLKFSKNTVIVFDFKEATSFEGETGIYCQNATVRLNSIFRKLENDAIETSLDSVKENSSAVSEVFGSDDGTDFWTLIMNASRLEETIDLAIANTEPAVLAKYTFALAKATNLFYQKHRIISEPDPAKKALMICAADIARRSLSSALLILGIEVPERM